MNTDPENPYRVGSQVPEQGPPPVYADPDTDTTGGVIPYKNPHALIAYYLGLFSLLPCIGLVLAIPALILGIVGLRNRNRNPKIRGSVHAWIGIVMGGLMTLIWTLAIAAMVIGTMAA